MTIVQPGGISCPEKSASTVWSGTEFISQIFEAVGICLFHFLKRDRFVHNLD
jgi:hypothetical protein